MYIFYNVHFISSGAEESFRINTQVLTFTTLWSESADNKLLIFFLIFPQKQDLTFHANCLHWRHYYYLHEMSKPVFLEK